MAGLIDSIIHAAIDTVKGEDARIVKDAVVNLVEKGIADKISRRFGKTDKQKSPYGEIVIRLPFLKSVERQVLEILALHPEREKLFLNLDETTIKDRLIFYDMDGAEKFHIKASQNNLKHIKLFQNEALVGELEKKSSLLKDLISVDNAMQFAVTLHGKEFGIIEVKERKILKTCVIPDFGAWEVQQKGISNYEVLDGAGSEIAKIYFPGDGKYILEYTDLFDSSMLVLSLMAIQMRKEGIRRQIKIEHYLP